MSPRTGSETPTFRGGPRGPAPTPAEVERALADAARFLVAGRSEDGPWRDFSTQQGVADAWTTAYVGLALVVVPEAARPEGWEAALAGAARWLWQAMDRFHGWGYNTRSPTDADSTAHAILFLRRCDVEVPVESYSRLLTFCRPDGGYATYLTPRPNDSWSVSHPCVTPMALQALLTALPPDHPRLAETLRYVERQQGADGTWKSFWWSTPLYSTALDLEAVQELDLDWDREALVRALELVEARTPFELALLGRCWHRLDRRQEADRTFHMLLDLQESDGAWPSEPMLRVTRRSCHAPWDDPDPGPLYADQERLFTTATVLRSLSERHRTPTHAEDPS